MNNSNDKKTIRIPIIVAVSIVIGILIGTFFFSKSQIKTNSALGSKYKEILMHIDRSYVDKVNVDSLSDYGIAKMLEKLDPHTVYLPAKEAEIADAELKNGFDGIGVEFNISNDSLYVVSVLSGGPSEAVGIQTGDIILKANNVDLTGKKLNNNLVFSNLRGERGSIAKLLIKRKGFKNTFAFNVKRDKIPTYTVDASYMMNKNTGYIKINRFGENTDKEFKQNVEALKRAGMDHLIIDLRDNPGGYMDKATNIIDELVAGKGVIVYTKGKDPANNYTVNAGKDGIFEKGKIAVLVDEGSASAAEIVSGSLQDYDRATIIGRRTFGKGLVQAPIMLADGSELRLTISRYYIPSGRGIQKPYQLGNQKEYYEDMMQRHKSKELFVKDSIKNNEKLKYKTKGGRTVYGGGGITPDIFMPEDTTYYSPYLFEIFGANVFREYVMNYCQSNGTVLKSMDFKTYLNTFKVSDAMLNNFNKLAVSKQIVFNQKQFDKSKAYIQKQIKALIARNIYKSKDGLQNEYFEVVNQNDKMIQTALRVVDK